MKNLNEITERIIGCAIEVHRHLGPGLLESIYEEGLYKIASDASFSNPVSLCLHASVANCSGQE